MPAAPSIFCTTMVGSPGMKRREVPRDGARRGIDAAARRITDDHRQRLALVEIGSRCRAAGQGQHRAGQHCRQTMAHVGIAQALTLDSNAAISARERNPGVLVARL